MKLITFSKVVDEMNFENVLFQPFFMEDGLENSLMTSPGPDIVGVRDSLGKKF